MRTMRYLLMAGLLALPSAAMAAAPDNGPKDFGPLPYHGDCRDAGGQVCVNTPWTAKMTTSPKVVKEGETVTATMTLLPGGVSFDMRGGGECTDSKEVKPQEVQNAEGRWEVRDVPVATSGSCTFKPAASGWRWQTYSAGVTGPCGSQIAVQEGRAEFAACAGTYASDYFGVIPKDADRYGISGRVSLTDGRGMAGVPITLAGPESKSMLTDSSGDYYFIVKKGTYTVKAGAKVCAVPIAGHGCAPSKTVTVPASQTVDFRPPGEGVIQGTVFGEGSKPKSGVTVHVVGPDGTTATTDGQGRYEARVPEGTYVLSASSTTDGKDPKTLTYCADDHGTFPAKCRATVTVDVKPDHVVNWALRPNPDDIQVEITGEETEKGAAFAATVKLTNPRKVALSNLTFAGSQGISVDTALQYGGTPVSYASGPDPALPTALGPEETVTLRYQLKTPEPGEAVLTVNVAGKSPDDKPVTGTGAMSVTVGKPVTQEDLDRLTINGVTNVLALADEHRQRIDKLFADKAADDAAGVTDADRQMAADLNLPPEMARMIAQRRAEDEAFWRGYGKGFNTALDKFGTEGGQFLANLYATIEDPVARREAAARIYEGAKALGPAAWENLGYLGEALKRSNTPAGLKDALVANAELASNVTTAFNEAYVGQQELNKQNAAAYKADPIKYREQQGEMWGDASFTGVKEAGFGALGEVGVRGIVAAAPKLTEAIGLSRLRNAETELNEARAAAEGTETFATATEEAAAMQRRIDLAEAASKTVQELPAGTLLDEAGLARAGIRPDDAKAVQGIIDEAKAKFGVDLQIGARTSEPLSAGIDGVAKREFIKPKAVSSLDQLLGAEPKLAGRASVFEPKMPPDDVLRGLEARNPGITDKLTARYNDQVKLYKEFQDPNSSLRTLVDAGKKYENGVTAIVERPGYRLPGELGKVEGQTPFAYLEQLDEPAFLQSRGISPQRAAEMKSELGRFPDSGRTKLLVENHNGTSTFIEGLEGKPIVSDLDLQFVEPKGGWPPGKRGQIETFVNNQMKKIDRFPQHGWSDAALDLPSENAELAAKFVLNTTNPATAQATAEGLSKQFKRMAQLLRNKANRTADPVLRAKLLDQAAKFEALTPAELLKKYPPGEKIIVFSAGDIRVGYGTGALK